MPLCFDGLVVKTNFWFPSPSILKMWTYMFNTLLLLIGHAGAKLAYTLTPGMRRGLRAKLHKVLAGRDQCVRLGLKQRSGIGCLRPRGKYSSNDFFVCMCMLCILGTRVCGGCILLSPVSTLFMMRVDV